MGRERSKGSFQMEGHLPWSIAKSGGHENGVEGQLYKDSRNTPRHFMNIISLKIYTFQFLN